MPTVLLIDDDPKVRSAIQAVLSSRKYGVFVAPDGVTGLTLFRHSRFDSVIVDIFMPEMDGIGTIREMRMINPDVPIIAISGHQVTNDDGSRPNFLNMVVKLGADFALQKPFRPEDLFAAIDHCARRARKPATPEILLSDRTTRRSPDALTETTPGPGH